VSRANPDVLSANPGARNDIAEVGWTGQGAGDLGLHRHVAGRLARFFGVGAVVLAVLQPGVSGQLPGASLERQVSAVVLRP